MVTATHLTTAAGTSATSFDTASVSPTADELVLITIAHTGSSTTPTVSGAGLTFDLVKAQAEGINHVKVFRAMSSSPSSGAITIDFDGNSQSTCIWSVAEFANVNRQGSNGANAVVQSDGNGATDTDNVSGLTVTLAAFADAANATYGGFMAIQNGGVGITPGSGFTELGEADDGGNRSAASEWKNSNDTSVDVTFSAAADSAVGVALEIAEVSTETAATQVMWWS